MTVIFFLLKWGAFSSQVNLLAISSECNSVIRDLSPDFLLLKMAPHFTGECLNHCIHLPHSRAPISTPLKFPVSYVYTSHSFVNMSTPPKTSRKRGYFNAKQIWLLYCFLGWNIYLWSINNWQPSASSLTIEWVMNNCVIWQTFFWGGRHFQGG